MNMAPEVNIRAIFQQGMNMLLEPATVIQSGQHILSGFIAKACRLTYLMRDDGKSFADIELIATTTLRNSRARGNTLIC